MENLARAEIKQKIAQLRAHYSRLRATCGPQSISKETIEEYAQELRRLLTELNK